MRRTVLLNPLRGWWVSVAVFSTGFPPAVIFIEVLSGFRVGNVLGSLSIIHSPRLWDVSRHVGLNNRKREESSININEFFVLKYGIWHER